MTTSELVLPAPSEQTMTSWAAVAFVASYSSPGTHQAYATQLRLWFDWCRQHGLDPLTEVRRPHVELYARDLEARGLAPATVALKLAVLTGFYRYCVEEQLLEHPQPSTCGAPRSPRSPPEPGSSSTEASSVRSSSKQVGPAATTTRSPACSPSTRCGSRKPAAPTSPTSASPTVTAPFGSSARATNQP